MEIANEMVGPRMPHQQRHDDGRGEILSNIVLSQTDEHAPYGGVVPEIASRAHVELLTPVVAQALVESGVADHDIEAVAATAGPGLVGSLLVGVSAAKAFALVWDVPFVAVNHLEAHLYAAFLEDPLSWTLLAIAAVLGGAGIPAGERRGAVSTPS